MPDTEAIAIIMDLLDAQLEKELPWADENPLWFGTFPGQTRAHIRFFADLALDAATYGGET